MDDLRNVLISFKNEYEEAIRNGTIESVIRSQVLINKLHEFSKRGLISRGVSPSKIYPPLNQSRPEKKIIGFLKSKNQDIVVFPSYNRTTEFIKKGAAIGRTDSYGTDFLSKTLILNVRSQLSSINKNFDTLYERSFAEALNLHMRLPLAVLGDLYLIPTVGYDSTAIKEQRIVLNEVNHLLKFISAYIALNNRTDVEDDHYKYERFCLLIVDFSQDPPYIINNFNEIENYLTDYERSE